MAVLVWSFGIFALGAVAALIFRKQRAAVGKRIAYTCSIAANVGLMLVGLAGLGIVNSIELPAKTILLPGVFSFTEISLQTGALSAFFLLLIGVLGLAATLYAIGYTVEYKARKSVSLLHAGALVFLLSMAGVVTAANVFTFLVFWEIMSVTSYFLVVYDHESPSAQKAGLIYIVMTHIGTFFLVICFFIIYRYSGSFEFAQMSGASLPKSAQSWVFILAFIGFGTKAGIAPLHIWLPRAHPSAPSHISALMSGVMIKTAIYGFLLVVIQLLHPGPLWWGIAAAAIGGGTALYGVLHALSEVDLKRMLAYSSIENMGLLFIGIGIALIFRAEQQPFMAGFALIAVLFHTANHALFKGLLFMGAGAVLTSSKTANMDLLGGLIRRMPWTALFMLLGALAIAAMPPLNGFVGEWLLIQSAFSLGLFSDSIGLLLIGALTIALLALIGALAAFMSIRFFSMTFLALPRSPQAEQAHETAVSMRIAMGLLTACCLLFGLLPFLEYAAIRKPIESLVGSLPNPSFSFAPLSVQSGQGGVAIGLTVLLIACGIGAAWMIARALGGKTRTVYTETWACGNPLTPRMTYTASGFSKPIRIVFRLLLKPSRSLFVDKNPKTPYFTRGYTYVSRIPLIIEDFLYSPAMNLLVAAANAFRKIQNGVVQSYLLYLFATLVFILIWVIGR